MSEVEPATKAGLALLADWDDRMTTLTAVSSRILAIEAEARADAEAQVAALHAVATEAAFNWQNPNEEREHEAMAALGEVLSDNAQAAKDHDARVVQPWREALRRYGSHLGDCPQKHGYACVCGFARALLAEGESGG